MPVIVVEQLDHRGRAFSPPRVVHLHTLNLEAWTRHHGGSRVTTISGAVWTVDIQPTHLDDLVDPPSPRRPSQLRALHR